MAPTVVLSTAYLAPVSYYCKLYAHEEGVWLDGCEHYVKQTFRNRCIIATENGPMALVVPIVRCDASHTAVRDIQLSDHGHWKRLHWQAMVSAYENSPYFEFYADDLRPLYERQERFLLDFNEQLRATVCELLDLHPRVSLSDAYIRPEDATNDYRNIISPKNNVPDSEFRAQKYYQVFQQRHGFLPNLSIVDLLFNMGPEALRVLRDSIAIQSVTPPEE